MHKKKVLLLLFSFTLILSGCSLKLKTKEIHEEEYISIGNELQLFGFGLGERSDNIREILGAPTKSTSQEMEFQDEELTVYSDHHISQMIVTRNPKFKISDDIHVGLTNEEL